MSTPADFLQSVTLRQLTSIRTSGDYRYLFDNGLNWVWFLHTNALARGLGLNAFKDVFISERAAEPYAEVEALLAALSTGPVGIGDRIGGADRDLVMRTCREDGVLVKPDAPLAALDRCFLRHGYRHSALLFGETHSDHPAGRWRYLVALHASHDRGALSEELPLSDLSDMSGTSDLIAYRWRTRSWQRLAASGALAVSLGFQEWDYWVLCPMLPGDRTVFGDVFRYATVGDRRIAQIEHGDDSLSFDVIGVPQRMVEVRGYAAHAPAGVEATCFSGSRPLVRQTGTAGEGWDWQAADGGWIVRVQLRSEMERIRILWA
jgi:hypothetical protein